MNRKVLFLLTLALASTTAVQPASAGELSATSLDRAIEEFDSTCVATFPNRKKFEHAVRKSGFSYSKAADNPTWSSSRAVISHVMDSMQPDQCNFDAALSAADNDSERVARAIESSLAKALGPKPARLVFKDAMKWEWQEHGAMHSISYYYGPSIPDRQLALTYRVDSRG